MRALKINVYTKTFTIKLLTQLVRIEVHFVNHCDYTFPEMILTTYILTLVATKSLTLINGKNIALYENTVYIFYIEILTINIS